MSLFKSKPKYFIPEVPKSPRPETEPTVEDTIKYHIVCRNVDTGVRESFEVTAHYFKTTQSDGINFYRLSNHVWLWINSAKQWVSTSQSGTLIASFTGLVHVWEDGIATPSE